MDFFLYLDCTNGFFGANCSEECHCNDKHHCNRTSGGCKTPGCIPGWKGLACNEGMFNQTHIHVYILLSEKF